MPEASNATLSMQGTEVPNATPNADAPAPRQVSKPTKSIKPVKGSARRRFNDLLARHSITVGGYMVLGALLLIFFYLLYVVAPIFVSASVDRQVSYQAAGAGNTLALGLEEQNEIGHRYTDTGEISFFRARKLEGSLHSTEEPGTELARFELGLTGEKTSFAQSQSSSGFTAIGMDNGQAVVVKPGYRTTFPQNQRLITPRLDHPLGESPLTLDTNGQALVQLAIETEEDTAKLAAFTADNRLLVTEVSGEENFMTEEVEWSTRTVEIPFSETASELLLTPDLATLYVRSDNMLAIYNVRSLSRIKLLQSIQLNDEPDESVTDMALLSGGSSLMVATDKGEISQYFQINTDTGREYKKIRTFETGAKLSVIIPEQFRKGFMAATADGKLGLYFATSKAELWQGEGGTNVVSMAISPRANGLLVQDGNTLSFYDVHNEHPEVTWSALWQEIWYENYPEADYVWQSSSANDDFEPKFSLVPISFGTIKAAFYAMLFATPLALAGAIYTAYFMSPAVRKTVKPTIEIMEALPTVILGFLAGLWLAPLVEEQLPGFLACLILLPVGILATAWGFSRLPEKIRQQVPDGFDALLLVPVVLLLGWLAFALSPWLEQVLFDGNSRMYLTNVLGIDFDQRNALIVGLAMGFAVIPTIFTIAEDAVFSVPKHLTMGSLALGATPWQTLVKVVLLTASPGIFSAVMMGIGRAVGETMIVLMATGNTPLMDWNIFEGMRTLSANIAVEMPESEVGSSHYRILFLAAFVLFVFTFVFNTLAEFVRQRLREKYSSL